MPMSCARSCRWRSSQLNTHEWANRGLKRLEAVFRPDGADNGQTVRDVETWYLHRTDIEDRIREAKPRSTASATLGKPRCGRPKLHSDHPGGGGLHSSSILECREDSWA